MVSLLQSAKVACLVLVAMTAIVLGAAPQPLSKAAGDTLVGGTARGCRNITSKCSPNNSCTQTLPDCDRRDPVVNTMKCVAQSAKACGGTFCGSPLSEHKCE